MIGRQLPVTAADVEQHNQSVLEHAREHRSQRVCVCGHRELRLHGLRRRKLRLLGEGTAGLVVRTVAVILPRLRCARCWATFTDFPAFVRPHRRYAADVIEEFARDHLEDGARSLAASVSIRPDGRPICHAAPVRKRLVGERLDGARLHPSTLLRWLVWLGAQTVALARAQRELLDHAADAVCHRLVGDIDPRRFRSPSRGAQLRTARRLLQVAQSWQAVFQAPLFPRLATRGPPA